MSGQDWSDGMDDRDWTGWTLYYRLCGDGTDEMDLPTGGVWDSGEARMLLDHAYSSTMPAWQAMPPNVRDWPLPAPVYRPASAPWVMPSPYLLPMLLPPPMRLPCRPREPSPWIAAALQLLGLCGVAGIGRMYLGDHWLGAAQMLVGFLTFGAGAVVWGLVDAVVIAVDG